MGMKPRAKPKAIPAPWGYLPLRWGGVWRVGYVEWGVAITAQPPAVVSRLLPLRFDTAAAAAKEASYQNLRLGEGDREVAAMAEELADRLSRAIGYHDISTCLAEASKALREHARKGGR